MALQAACGGIEIQDHTRSRQRRTANSAGKRARHASLQPTLQLPIGFENPSTSCETERQANLEGDSSVHARAVASEVQTALDRAEDEAPSNSESKGDCVCSSTLGAWSVSDGASASSSEEDDDDLPLAAFAASGFAFQNLTTAEEWKTAEAPLPGKKRADASTTRSALYHRKRRQDERTEKKRKKPPDSTKPMIQLHGSIPVPSPGPIHKLNFRHSPRWMLYQATSQPRTSANQQIA